jgi:oxygen-independent coproporphyrinogen-3 oxidase
VASVSDTGAGIYLHVPFCAHRCHYCDFNTYAGMGDLIPRYMAALRADVERTAAAGPAAVGAGRTSEGWPVFSSVFVGGGTPTLVPPDDLAEAIGLLGKILPLADDAEVTVEANPETVTVSGMRTLRSVGVNRVSMGAQSFAPHVLRALGRWHEVDRPLRAVEQVREAGIERINVDLIYGTPSETEDDWRASLAAVIAAGAEHVSAYALTVEPNTEYARRIRQGAALAPDDDVQAERMAIGDEVLASAGLERYELSNWARPGRECRHNLVYWQGGDWLGVGAGAHGHWQGRRWWHLRAPARYADAALAGESTVGGHEIPTVSERRTERLLMGLRTVAGVAADRVRPIDASAVDRLVTAGLLRADAERLRLTPEGFKVANSVTVALL